MEGIITRANFKDMRVKHHISQADIAKRAGISKGCISDFETKNTGRLTDHIETRKDNEAMIIRALTDMIDEGFRSDLMRGEVMINTKGNYVKAHVMAEDPNDEYLTLMNNIKKYISLNNITCKEFCDMVGVSKRIFEINFNKGRKVTDRFKEKLEKATGWKYEDMISGRINEEDVKMSWIPAPSQKYVKDSETNIFKKYKEVEAITEEKPKEKPEEKSTEAIETFKINIEPKKETECEAKEVQSDSKEINPKYIFENGKCYKEYDVVITKHMMTEISKEEFMKAIN